MRVIPWLVILLSVILGPMNVEAQSGRRNAAKSAEAAKPKSGSLWQRGDKHRITTREGKKRSPIEKNNLILVLVLETATASNDARLDTRRKLETDLLLDSFVRFSRHKLKPDFSPLPEIEMEAERKLQAKGKTDRKESVRLRVQARVVDVRDNGNLIIEARKEKRINEEETTVILTGEIRSLDVGNDYSIPSDRVADMKLSYYGKGPVSRNAGTTWYTWLVDHIWPF